MKGVIFMAILAECPTCRRKQATKNKVCKCGESLDKAKKSRKVRYWITYRLPGGKQRKEAVASFADLNPYSIEDARTAEAKRRVHKKKEAPGYTSRIHHDLLRAG